MPVSSHVGAVAPGLAAPSAAEKGEARVLPGGAGFGAEGKAKGTDTHSADDDAAGKAFADYRARLLLAGGHQAHRLSGGRYLVAMGGWCREFDDLQALERFTARVEGRP